MGAGGSILAVTKVKEHRIKAKIGAFANIESIGYIQYTIISLVLLYPNIQ